MLHSNLLIGELLSELGIVSPADIERGCKLSDYLGLPVGKCLLLLECLTPTELKAALEAQALLRERVLTRDVLAIAIEVAFRQQWSLSDALISIGHDAHSTNRTRLGELLADAHIVNDKQLRFALDAAEFSCLPLGNILTSFSAVGRTAIRHTLRLQSAIRLGSIDRASAIKEIKSLDEPVEDSGERTDKVHFRLGELLERSQILTSHQIQHAVEESSRHQLLTGQYLIEHKHITDETLTAALCMQTLLDAELSTVESACDIIAAIADLRAVTETESENISFNDFLRASGYLNSHRLVNIAAANPTENVTEMLRDATALRACLVRAFPDERNVINAGAMIFELLKGNKVTLSQALLIFSFKQRNIRIADASRSVI